MLLKILSFFPIFIFVSIIELHATTYKPMMGQVAETPIDASLLKEDKLRIYFCGTGNPQLTMQAIRKPACLAVLTKDDFFVIDAGEGTSQTLALLGLPYPAINKAFITHLHSDHLGGLASLMNNTWKDGRTTPFEVYGPFGIEKVVSGLNTAFELDILYRVINSIGALDPSIGGGVPKLLKMSREPVKVYSKGDLEVSSFSVDHTPVYPAVGYALKYKNCRIVVSGDTRVVNSLAKASKNVDVLINEALSQAMIDEALAKFQKEPTPSKKVKEKDIEITKALSNYHSSTYELAKMAEKAQVKELFLTHLVPAIFNTKEAKEAFMKNMDTYYKGPITIVDDGDSLVIESDGKNCKVQYVPYK